MGDGKPYIPESEIANFKGSNESYVKDYIH